ncbi:MAG: cytochrome C oxidase subunit IV family protein [Syntrophotaleaceae bacterium]
MTEGQERHVIGFSGLIAVWIALLLLTAVTVTVSRLDFGPLNIWVALGIAALKAALVSAYFMHLKYESLLFKMFFLGVVATLAIFIGLTFFDVLYR